MCVGVGGGGCKIRRLGERSERTAFSRPPLGPAYIALPNRQGACCTIGRALHHRRWAQAQRKPGYAGAQRCAQRCEPTSRLRPFMAAWLRSGEH